MRYSDKIIEYGLYLLVFLLPVQTRWIIRDTGLEYTTISLYGTDILLFLIILLFLDWKIKNRNFEFRISNFEFFSPWLFLGLIELAAFISILFAGDKWLAAAGYARLLLALGLFWIITKAEYDKWKLGYFFIGGMFVQSLLAIWQFLSQSTFSSKWFGIANHSASGLAGESVIEAAGGRWLRSYGGFDHPNVLGGVLAISAIIILAAVMQKIRQEWMSGGWKEKIKNISILGASKLIFIFYTVLLLFVSALFFTFSRASWLSLAVGVFSMAAYFIVRRKREEQFIFGKIMLAVCLVFFTLNFIYGALVSSRADLGGRLENKSISERMRYFNDFKSIIRDDWVSGVGLGNYSTAVEKKFPGRPIYDYQPVHNAFFLIWSEIGILGVLGMLGIFVYLIIMNYRLNVLNLSFFLSFIVLSSLDHWLWSLHFGIFFTFFILGYSYRQARSEISGVRG